ncbi:MAG: TraX family protein [Clostridia bacterium]|nr:TraX family protein [Clostridia bacterium]
MIKFLAALFMLVDHIGLSFFPNSIWFRLVGRLSMPLFAFCVARAFAYSENKVVERSYFLRILGFSAVSQLPYSLFLFSSGSSFLRSLLSLNIGFTWLLSVAVLCLIRRAPPLFGVFGVSVIFFFSLTDFVSYGALGVFLPVLFYFFLCHKDFPLLAWAGMCVGTGIYAVLLQAPIQYASLGAFLFIIFWRDYKKDATALRAIHITLPRKFFYAFYPVHLAVLSLVCFAILPSALDSVSVLCDTWL